MIDCNRHRPNGYKDKTWVDRIPDEFIDEFKNRRDFDIDRSQNLVNQRFPQLQEARDMYLTHEMGQSHDLDNSLMTTTQKKNAYISKNSPRNMADKWVKS